jgi:hypothetical protein
MSDRKIAGARRHFCEWTRFGGREAGPAGAWRPLRDKPKLMAITDFEIRFLRLAPCRVLVLLHCPEVQVRLRAEANLSTFDKVDVLFVLKDSRLLSLRILKPWSSLRILFASR